MTKKEMVSRFSLLIFCGVVASGCASEQQSVSVSSAATPAQKPKHAQKQRVAWVREVEFSPDQTLFAIIKRIDGVKGINGEIEVWDARQKRQVVRRNSSLIVSNVSFLGQNQLAVLGGDSLQIWSIVPLKLKRTLKLKNYSQVLATSRSGRMLATESQIWQGRDLSIGSFIQSREKEFIRTVAISPDEKTIVTGAWDVEFGIEGFDAKTGRKIWETTDGQQSNAAFSPDGRVVGVGTTRGIVLLAPKTGRRIRTLGQSYGGQFWFMDNETIVQINEGEKLHKERTLVTYAVSTGKILRTEPPLGEHEFISPNGKIRFQLVGDEKTVKFQQE